MSALPIVERELRAGARNPLSGALVFLLLIITSPVQLQGMLLLHLCFGGLFLVSLFAGVQITADAISREKREGTIGLLFLTDLKGYDVVLGKLCSSSIYGAYALFGILPVISVIFLLGGVEWGTVLRLVISCASTAFLSLSAGLLASVLSVQEKRAKALAVTFILVTIAGVPAGGLILLVLSGGYFHGGDSYWLPFLLSSPVMTYVSSVSTGWGGGLWVCLVSNLLVCLTGGVFLGLSCWLVKRTWQDKGESKELPRSAWTIFRGVKQMPTGLRTAMLDLNPIHWLTMRESWRGHQVWATLWLTVTGFAIIVLFQGSDALNPVMAIALALALNTLIKFSLIGEASRWLAQDRQSGVLELILTTPLGELELFEGQRLSLRKLYQKPIAVAAVVELGFMLLTLGNSGMSGGDNLMLLYLLAVMLIMLVVDCRAITWVGMWHAISVMPLARARQQTIKAVMVWPWAIFYAGLLVIVAPMALMDIGGDLLMFLYWPAVMAGVALSWINQAKTNLQNQFRERAMEQFVEERKPARLERWKTALIRWVAPREKAG
jgi:ABC-type multidrug transport system permease subunit